jgi:hypothetical protein
MYPHLPEVLAAERMRDRHREAAWRAEQFRAGGRRARGPLMPRPANPNAAQENSRAPRFKTSAAQEAQPFPGKRFRRSSNPNR